MKTFTATATAAVIAMSAGQSMAAAAAPAAAATTPAVPTVTYGAPITGLCVLSGGQVQASSLYGKAIDKQLETLANQANAELTTLSNNLGKDAATLNANKTTMTELKFAQESLLITSRQNDLQALAQVRNREMAETENQQNALFDQTLQTVALKVLQDRQCSILLDAQTVMTVSPTMNLTDAVTKAMDQTKTTATFSRAVLPPAAATKAN